MPINPVMTAIYAAFKLEIANQFIFDNYALTITLPDQSKLAITAIPVQPHSTRAAPPNSTTPRNDHTFHYLHQHDFTADNRPLGKLLLHNLEECRAYLDDVCTTFLYAHIHDGEIQISNNTTYLITIEPVQ